MFHLFLKKLFLVFFYFVVLSLLKYDSFLYECKSLYENDSNQTNSTQNKIFSNFYNVSNGSNSTILSNDSTIEVDLFLRLVKSHVFRLLHYLNRFESDDKVSDTKLKSLSRNSNQSNFNKTNRIINTYEEDERLIESDLEDILNISSSINENFKAKYSDSGEIYSNELSSNEITKLTNHLETVDSNEKIIAKTGSSSIKYTHETNIDLVDTTTSANDFTVTTTSNKILTTLSLPYQENPYFMQCVNACGSDHECIRQKCLLDSTYFG